MLLIYLTLFPVKGEADLEKFVDCLTTYYCHNLTWPKGMTDKLYNISWNEMSWQTFTFFKYPTVANNSQVGIGFLLRDIWKVEFTQNSLYSHCNVPCPFGVQLTTIKSSLYMYFNRCSLGLLISVCVSTVGCITMINLLMLLTERNVGICTCTCIYAKIENAHTYSCM